MGDAGVADHFVPPNKLEKFIGARISVGGYGTGEAARLEHDKDAKLEQSRSQQLPTDHWLLKPKNTAEPPAPEDELHYHAPPLAEMRSPPKSPNSFRWQYSEEELASVRAGIRQNFRDRGRTPPSGGYQGNEMPYSMHW